MPGDDPIVRHGGAVAVVAAAWLAVGMLCNGFDNGFGNALSCLLNAAFMACLLLIAPPPLRFWAWIAPPLLMALAAAAWLALPLTDWGRSLGAHSLVPDLALSQYLGFTASVVALVSGCLIGIRHQRRPLIDWLLVFAGLEMLFGLMLWQDDWPLVDELWSNGREGRFAGTLGNANVAAALYGAIAVLALARALARGRTQRPGPARRRDMALRTLHWLLILLALGAVVATASRAAMALTLGAMLVLVLFTFRRGRRRVVLSLAGLGAIVATLFLAGYADVLFERSRVIASSSLERGAMWEHGLNLVRAAPLFGYGSGSFPLLNQQSLTDPRTAAALWTINSPHNILLRLALDGGLPYLVLVSLAALWIAGSCLLAFGTRGWDLLNLGIALAVCVILGCAMVDIAMDVPAVITVTLFLAGLLWGRAFTRLVPLPS